MTTLPKKSSDTRNRREQVSALLRIALDMTKHSSPHRNICPSLFLLIAGGISVANAQVARVQGPNGRVQIALDSAQGHLSYSVQVHNRDAIESSALGVTVDGLNLGENATLGAPVTRNFRETYPMMGTHARAINAYREAIFPLQSGAEKTGN